MDKRINCNNCPLCHVEVDTYCEQYCSDMADFIDEIRTDAIEELKGKKDEIIRWLIKRDKEGYGTTNGELLDHILEIAEQLKEQK